MKNGHKLLLKYGITIAVAGLFSLLFMWGRGLWTADTPMEQYKILADAFSVPGPLSSREKADVKVGHFQRPDRARKRSPILSTGTY